MSLVDCIEPSSDIRNFFFLSFFLIEEYFAILYKRYLMCVFLHLHHYSHINMLTTTSESTLKRKKESSSNTNDVQSRSLGEGDSYYDESIISSEAAVEILKRLDEQIVYLPRSLFKFRIFHKLNVLPRDKAFYGDVQADGSCECCVTSSREILVCLFLIRSTLSI